MRLLEQIVMLLVGSHVDPRINIQRMGAATYPDQKLTMLSPGIICETVCLYLLTFVLSVL